jgi:hypothetical protein
MKSFDVFTNAMGEIEIVKDGFSWPAFFFSWIWGFIAKLWVHASIMLVATLVLVSVPGAPIIVGIIAGFKGNEWRRDNLQQRGFTLAERLQAESADAAKNQFVAGQSDSDQEAASSADTSDRLRDLKQLLDDGVLTQDEYEEKRRALVENL